MLNTVQDTETNTGSIPIGSIWNKKQKIILLEIKDVVTVVAVVLVVAFSGTG